MTNADPSPGDARAATPTGLSLGALTALVVGSMIGGGIFALPRQMAEVAAPGPLVIGWLVTGLGMLMLAFVFQTLAVRRPDVDGGVYGYARAGFGSYIGFNSAWGYWISAWIGNVGYLVLVVTGAGHFVPGLVADDGALTVAGAAAGSAVLWLTSILCIRGVREAAVVNTIVTIAKVVPIVVFLVLMVVAFRADLFSADIWGSTTRVDTGDGPTPLGGTLDQVKAMMLVTVWVFIGIEGASIFSQRARRRADVGKATVLGFVGVLVLLVFVNLISYGAMRQAELAGVSDPALGSILENAVGPWGASLIAGGLVVSVLGAFLSWTLLCAEILRLPAQEQVMPRILGRDNAKGSPMWAVLLTGVCTQATLVWAQTRPGAYDTLILLASSLILVPYLWATLFQLKLVVTREGYAGSTGRGRDLAVGVIATVYAVWLLYAAGVQYLLIAALIYAVGTVVYAWARRESGLRLFTGAERVVVAVVLVGALAGALALTRGTFTG